MFALHRLCAIGLTVLVYVALLAGVPASAQTPTEVRTRDGRVFFADSIQIRGNIAVIRPHGLGIVEIPMADLLCVGAACGSSPSPGPSPSPTLTGASRIGVQGSNTIGAALMPALIRAYGENVLGGAVNVEFGASSEEQTIRIRQNDAERAVVDLAAHGSGTAFEGLLAGTAAIGMSSRGIKPDEAIKLNQAFGINMLSPESEHIIALDGLAIIVNRANPMKEVAFTLDTIASLFSGEISDWSQLGGQAGPIAIHARDQKSGTFSTFDDLVMKPHGKALSPAAKRYESSDDLSEAVDKDPAAIGFIGLTYIQNNAPLQIGSSCGIAHGPSRFTVQTEVYPLSRRLFLYTPGATRDPFARDLIAYIVSDAAQPVIADNGFIDQRVEFEDSQLKQRWIDSLDVTADRRTSREDLQAIKNAASGTDRASVDFRFASGSSRLDNKALADVRRLAQMLRTPEMQGRNWWLVGFADSDGSFRTNLRLSGQRANAVKEELQREGIRVSDDNLAGFSWLGPVACNDDESGRALNRRVEVWVEHRS